MANASYVAWAKGIWLVWKTKQVSGLWRYSAALRRFTSPTPDCGKTLTALNLALSIARQPERSVLLVDLDIQKGYVASSLGLRCEGGVLGVLEGRTPLSTA